MTACRYISAMIALMVLAGCDGTTDKKAYNGPPWPEACVTDSDCEPSQACSLKHGICRDRLPAGSLLSLSVVPRPQAKSIPDQFADIEVETPGRLDMTMAPPITIQGVLAYEKTDVDERMSPPSGRLVAEGEGVIPGIVTRRESQRITESGGFAWSLRLLPEIDYRVNFLPDDPARTTWTWSLNVGLSGGAALRLPAESTIYRLNGLIRYLSNDVRLPMPKVGITATVGKSLASYTTSDSNGAFSLDLPPLDGEVTIRITPGDSGHIFPDAISTWADLETLKADVPPTGLMLLDVETVTAPVSVDLYVVGVRDSVTRIPVGGTGLYLKGETGNGVYRINSVVDGSSVRRVQLPRAVYTIDAVPPGYGLASRLRASSYSIGRRIVDLTTTNDRFFAIELPLRPRISGKTVWADSGEAIQGARVTFASMTTELFPGDADWPAEIVHEALSDENGDFSARLDPGRYALHVQPPAGSGLAVASWPVVDIDGTENLQISLTDACLLQGKLTASDGSPLDSAMVTFFLTPDQSTWDEWTLKESSFSRSVRQMAQAKTDSEGNFEVLLPHPARPAGAIGSTFAPWR